MLAKINDGKSSTLINHFISQYKMLEDKKNDKNNKFLNNNHTTFKRLIILANGGKHAKVIQDMLQLKPANVFYASNIKNLKKNNYNALICIHESFANRKDSNEILDLLKTDPSFKKNVYTLKELLDLNIIYCWFFLWKKKPRISKLFFVLH